jgi:hypothetical protein
MLSTSAFAELKVYDVDAQYRQEVFAALRGVLEAVHGGGPVQLLPTGQLLINATPEMHEQVAAVLRAVSEYDADPVPRVTLQYWLVLGTSESAGNTDTPTMLRGVLDEIRQVHGPLSFRVLSNATLVTDSGRQGENNGGLQVHQLAYVQGTTLNVELRIGYEFQVVTGQVQGGAETNPFQTVQREYQGIQLNTSMARDEFVVVGENTIGTNIVGPGATDEDGTVFYIVHWPAE